MVSETAIFWTGVALLGLLVGSFLNVVILRWPTYLLWSWRQEARAFLEIPAVPTDTAPPTVTWDRSRCPSCGHQLAWWENIPVFSFLLLRGKCRACHTKISWQYPAVELLTALSWLAVVAVYGFTITSLWFCGLFTILIALSGIDQRTMLLPDPLVYVVLWTGLLASVLEIPGLPAPSQAILGALAGYIAFWSVAKAFWLVTRREGMGGGDVKLLAGLGAWLGPLPLLPLVLIAVVIGITLTLGRKALSSETEAHQPFGPALALAGASIVLLGPDTVSVWLTRT